MPSPVPSPLPIRSVESTDSTAEDFAAGVVDKGAYLFRSLSEVTLLPAVIGEFDQPTVPVGWSVELAGPSASASFGADGVALDRAGIYADGVVTNDRALEFGATFAPRPNQHAGLALDFVGAQWVSFSTKYGNALYARTRFYIAEDERLPASLLGTPHRYRIDWNVLDIDFSVDGTRLAHLMVPVPAFMRPGAANTGEGGRDPMRLGWMLATPYRPFGRFRSRVHGTGRAIRWTTCDVDAGRPEGTDLTLAVRFGETVEPDDTWSEWHPVGPDGLIDHRAGYVQYVATLTTSKSRVTPALRRVTLAGTA